MKKALKWLLAALLCGCVAFAAAACAGGFGDNAGGGTDTEQGGSSAGPSAPGQGGMGGCEGSLPDSGQGNEGGGENVNAVSITIGANTAEMTLADTAAAEALAQRLADGGVTFSVSDYGGFEKVGDLGFSLPASDERIAAETGDVMLYLGDQIVFFYGNNTWSYTRIGRIEGLSREQLRDFLCAGQGEVRVALGLAG